LVQNDIVEVTDDGDVVCVTVGHRAREHSVNHSLSGRCRW